MGQHASPSRMSTLLPLLCPCFLKHVQHSVLSAMAYTAHIMAQAIRSL